MKLVKFMMTLIDIKSARYGLGLWDSRTRIALCLELEKKELNANSPRQQGATHSSSFCFVLFHYRGERRSFLL